MRKFRTRTGIRTPPRPARDPVAITTTLPRSLCLWILTYGNLHFQHGELLLRVFHTLPYTAQKVKWKTLSVLQECTQLFLLPFHTWIHISNHTELFLHCVFCHPIIISNTIITHTSCIPSTPTTHYPTDHSFVMQVRQLQLTTRWQKKVN